MPTMSTPFVPPLDWPHYGIGPIPAVKRIFQKYAIFSGRAGRGEFWWWVLANGVVSLVLYGLTLGLGIGTATRQGDFGIGGIPFAILLGIWALATIVPSIAVSIRRLHDAGFSGWFYLFNVFGLGIVTVVLCALPTSPAAAQYGPPYPDAQGQGFPPQQGDLAQDPYAHQQGYPQQGYPQQGQPQQGPPQQYS